THGDRREQPRPAVLTHAPDQIVRHVLFFAFAVFTIRSYICFTGGLSLTASSPIGARRFIISARSAGENWTCSPPPSVQVLIAFGYRSKPHLLTSPSITRDSLSISFCRSPG